MGRSVRRNSMELHGTPWIKAQGSRIKAHGSRVQASGSRLKDQDLRIKAQGSRLKDQGSRIEAQGSRTEVKDQGPCAAMNEHPRRPTDVILSQSKDLIEIFTCRWVPWQDSWSKYLRMPKQRISMNSIRMFA